MRLSKEDDRRIGTCLVCGSLLSAVTFTCVLGQYCKPPKANKMNRSKNEHSKVMARLESQLQKDGLTYRETLPDGTMVYRRDAQ